MLIRFDEFYSVAYTAISACEASFIFLLFLIDRKSVV